MIISSEVKKALKLGRPVIALESTITTHGMPYPENYKCALMVEDVIRKENCVPATIAIIDGEIYVGLSKDQLLKLAKNKNSKKVSRRDLPIIMEEKLCGGTTVSATMIIASLAGIKIFATGGIGGVHRGASDTFDISTDLEELKSTSVCVVCAGPKAILDLNKTMEVLETNGVPVISYKSDYLPAFYTNKTDLRVDMNAKNPKVISNVLRNKWDKLKLNGGVLVCNPVDDKYSLDSKYIGKLIDKAIKQMNKKHIIGKDQTPFLLSKIKELSNGVSLDTNIKLVLSNAKLASQIAKEYYKKSAK